MINITSRNRYFIVVILLIKGLFFSVCAFAVKPDQQIFKHLTVEDGLVQNSVLAIHQDSKGFMWFGTYNGLSRYDGYEFYNYHYDSTSDSGLPAATINTIIEDNNGFLWLGTDNGLVKFDMKLEKFSRYTCDLKNTGPACDYIYDMLLIDTNLWLGTTGGLYLFNINNGNMKKIDIGKNEYRNMLNISSIAKSKDGMIWLTAGKRGLINVNTITYKWKEFPIEQNSEHNNSAMTVAYYNNNLWLSTENGLYIFNEEQGDFSRIIIDSKDSEPFILKLLASDGKLWVGTTRDGLYQYELDSNNRYRYLYNSNNTTSIASNSISSLFLSNDKTLWIGSRNQGISFTNTTQGFQIYKNIPGKANSLQDDVVNQIFYDNNKRLWFRTSNGISVYNEKLDNYKHYSLPYRIRGIYQGADDILWIASQAGLYQLNNKTESMKKITDIHFIGVETVYQFNKQELIIANSGGKLIHWKIGEKGYREILIEPETKLTNTPESKLVLGRISFFKKSTHELWAATASGLFSLNLKTLTLHHLPASDLKKHLSNTSINYISKDENLNTWIATTNKGLYKISENLKILNILTRADGLPDNTIRALATVKNVVWISTDNGLARIYNNGKKHFIDSATEKFFNSEFQHASILKINNNRLLFGGVNGALEFNPLTYRHDKNSIKVQFTDFQLLNKPVNPGSKFLTQSIRYENSITLNYKQSLMSFSFSALDYMSPNLHYAYQLDGYGDSEWFFMNHKNRRAVFTTLPAGTYTLKVKATNSLNNWDTPETHLTINITPPWWKTIWAYISYFILIIASIAMFIRYRTYRLVKLAKQLEDTVAERTEQVEKQKDTIEQLLDKKNEMFANISHELRTPITLIQGPIKQSLEKTANNNDREPLLLANRNIQRLSFLVDQLLQLSRMSFFTEESKCLSPLSKIANLIAASFKSISVSQNIKLNLDIEDDVWVSALPNSLETLVINLLSNAFKYTESGGQVSFIIKSNNQQVTIRVKDTGVGMPEDQITKIFDRFTRLESSITQKVQGVGIGLALVKQLVDMHTGSINVTSKLGAGSEFVITLPCETVSHDEEQELILAQESLNQLHHLETILNKSDEDSSPNIADKEIQTETDKKPKLLIIDDTEDMRNYLQSLLHGHYQCLLASNGEEGVELAKSEMPDIIISDVMMPGISGFEVLDKLRDDLNTSHIPVLMLTAKGDKESRVLGLSKLADDYITKPFDADELKARLHGILTIRKLQQQQLHHLVTIEDSKKDKGWDQLDLNPKEQEFLNKLNDVLSQNYQDGNFNVEQLAKYMHVSERSLQYKTRALFGKTPNEYIREYRLNKAKSLILNKDIRFASIAEHVGFSNSSYFNKCFKAYMGRTPKEFYQENTKN